eukprot:TRINITY_DN4588_c0_g1_i1.p1 TRINITY_DN4588_c0_g1~~TRINITY_DN4588_c0_g1_i1.p1  ORF type:complete len:591 (+),score=124.98 TRINITY_DN4588_c0_g1_i1:80-1852(+)
MDEEAFVRCLREELQCLRQQLLEDFRGTAMESGLDLLKARGQADKEASSGANRPVAEQESTIRRIDNPATSDVQKVTPPGSVQAMADVDFGFLPNQSGRFDAIQPMVPAVMPVSPDDDSASCVHVQSQNLCLSRINKKKLNLPAPEQTDASAAVTYFTQAKKAAHALISFSARQLLVDEDAVEHMDFLKRIKSSARRDTTGASFASYDSSLRLALAKVLFSGCFEGFVLLLILSNSVWLGVQVEFAALHFKAEPPRSFRVLDTVFSVCFGLELLLRLFVFRAYFCAGRDCWWNLFDMLLVAVQVAEEIAFAYGADDRMLASSMVLRSLRICRAIRVIRIFRVLKYLQELRLLLTCIVRSTKAFFWAVVLLAMMNYICSIFFTQVVTTAREERGVDMELLKWHGSVQRSFLSLLQGMLGGCDWGDLVQPFLTEGMPFPGLLMTAYISFSILSVMNLVTGTFVDSAIHWANEERKTHTVEQMKHMFRFIDLDTSGEISFDEIKGQLHAKPVTDFFKQIDVHTDEAEMLFQVLDGDGTGSLSLEEFVHGCMRLQTPSTSLDILLLSQEIRASLDEIHLNQHGRSSEAGAAAQR